MERNLLLLLDTDLLIRNNVGLIDRHTTHNIASVQEDIVEVELTGSRRRRYPIHRENIVAFSAPGVILDGSGSWFTQISWRILRGVIKEYEIKK